MLWKNFTFHQFPECARTHQLRGISMVSHFFNVEQMCRDVRREAKTEKEKQEERRGGAQQRKKERERERKGGERDRELIWRSSDGGSGGGRVVTLGGKTRCRIVRSKKRGGTDGEDRSRSSGRRKRSARLLNGVRDKKQIRFTHSRFPLANSISSGVPLTLCL